MPQNRRAFLKNSAFAAAGVSLATAGNLLTACESATEGAESYDSMGSTVKLVKGEFVLPELPYAPEALEPHIDAQTMRILHGKHHSGYVRKLNLALEEADRPSPNTLDEILRNLEEYPEPWREDIRQNGGGHWNHSFFWPSMQAEEKRQAPLPEDLAKALNKHFGSIDEFKAAFTDAAKGRFGSGWAWLVKSPEGKLAVGSTPNQDNPLMKDAELQGEPLLGLDVWEHAYYLKYQNKRGAYIQHFWNLVNWERVANLLG